MAGMNRQVHLVIGIAAFLVYFYAMGLFHISAGALFVFGIVAVSAGSLFPDIVEPATSARHRGIFHSRLALKLAEVLFLIMAVMVLLATALPRLPVVFAASCFFLGYAAHLLADSMTRAGLPG
jgi:membrane-bound metal-dependent hydrolase YbcI (DUF457 family)